MKFKMLKLLSLMAVCVALGAGAAMAAQKSKKELILIPGGTAKYVSANPADPEHSPQVSFVYGDPAKGPVAFLLKWKGAEPLHWHSSDYWGITVEGVTKHWQPGTEPKENPPGTFWFQPGGDASTAHSDTCMTDSGCTLFVFMDKKNDIFMAGGK